MRFFEPTERFWDWLEQFRGKRIIDIGCGDGSLLREMTERGFECVGIDPRYCPSFLLYSGPPPADIKHMIVPLPVERCQPVISHPDTIYLCCRPCHNGFSEHAAEWIDPTSRYFYIGLEHNAVIDLGKYVAGPILREVGEDDELIVEVAKAKRDRTVDAVESMDRICLKTVNDTYA